MIIGVAGTLASGKGAVVEYLKTKGFTHYSSSARLKEMLTERGEPLTRPYMSALATELMQEHPGGVLELSYRKAQADGAQDYVLEAIHRPTEAAYIKSLGGFVIGVDADIHTRYERTAKRADGAKDDVTFEQFVEHSTREDEGKSEGGINAPNIRAVLKGADAVVMNDGTLEELHAQIDTALERIKK